MGYYSFYIPDFSRKIRVEVISKVNCAIKLVKEDLRMTEMQLSQTLKDGKRGKNGT